MQVAGYLSHLEIYSRVVSGVDEQPRVRVSFFLLEPLHYLSLIFISFS